MRIITAAADLANSSFPIFQTVSNPQRSVASFITSPEEIKITEALTAIDKNIQTRVMKKLEGILCQFTRKNEEKVDWFDISRKNLF
jgi:cobalamin biosynthesis protein CbiD